MLGLRVYGPPFTASECRHTRFSTLEQGQSADHMAMSAQSAAPVGGSHPRHRSAVTGASLTGSLCRQLNKKHCSAAAAHPRARDAAGGGPRGVRGRGGRRAGDRRRRRIHVPRLRVRGEPHRLVRRRVGHRVHLRPGDVPYLCKQGRRPDDGARLQAPGLQLRVRHARRGDGRRAISWVTQWCADDGTIWEASDCACEAAGGGACAAPGWDDDDGYDDDGAPCDYDPGSCVDDRTTTDAFGDDCAWYTCNQGECGDYDDGDFAARDQCCACGGGTLAPSASDDDTKKPSASDDGGDGCVLHVAGPVVTSKSNQVATVDSLQNYELAFTMELASDWTPSLGTGHWQSILRIGNLDYQRLPGIWFHETQNALYVMQSYSGCVGSPWSNNICEWGVTTTGVTFTAGVTYEIRVVVESNQMTVYADGVSVGTASGPAVDTVTDAAVYVGDPWWDWDTAKVTLSDVTLSDAGACDEKVLRWRRSVGHGRRGQRRDAGGRWAAATSCGSRPTWAPAGVDPRRRRLLGRLHAGGLRAGGELRGGRRKHHGRGRLWAGGPDSAASAAPKDYAVHHASTMPPVKASVHGDVEMGHGSRGATKRCRRRASERQDDPGTSAHGELRRRTTTASPWRRSGVYLWDSNCGKCGTSRRGTAACTTPPWRRAAARRATTWPRAPARGPASASRPACGPVRSRPATRISP